ncbi:hypothetical protein HTV80_12520 [Streptomyces sp. Vc74B-19]|uniref:hypothetical protein n=1 Tax=Streptomyces sp. Vc74B-19 TaxID=2741324 RepID=UPI001BFC2104|nr:hypothetical protein [Streptomyces sp. Vc74B-19]MBT3163932.1 hypothetical protein [Streptomyces sp. Vc74B-19]
MTVKIEDWTCRLDFPVGWVDLTAAIELGQGGKACWAREVVNSFNPLEILVSRESIENELISLAGEAEKTHAVLAAAYFAEGGANLATFDVQIFGEEGVVLSLDEVESRLLRHRGIVGDPRVSRVDLPTGPAMRLQAIYQSKGVLGFGKRLSESVSYALLVPQTQDVLLATTTWRAMEHSGQLTEMTDAFMPTLRLIPLDAEGNPMAEAGSPGV